MAVEPPRPLLLPQNRKIRHVQGIYLRNLTLPPSEDAIADNGSKTSGTKSRSFQDHKPPLQRSKSFQDNVLKELQKDSINWAGASASLHQRTLEQVRVNNSADTFITLHCASQMEPIYISEIIENSINPTFRQFDLSVFGPKTTRLDTLTVKIWIKRNEFSLFIDEEVNLRSLNYIGKLENHQFPANCILFDLIDGIYSMDLAIEYQKPRPGVTLPTSSYSSLLHLSNLDQSIQDALATREELAAQITHLLERINVAEALQAEEQVILANRYLNSQRRLLKISLKRREDLIASIEARKKGIKSGMESQAKAVDDIENAQDKLMNCRKMLTNIIGQLCGQRRRICEELHTIYPIDPILHKPLLFTICGLPLPNSFFDDSDEETVSAALGYVAHIVDLLQYYLSIPLPYPISPYGSRAIIKDFISIIQDKQRTFPLYIKGAVRFRFDYGVFLLNKNIEWLAKRQGLKIIDIRHTLPNLKYLLYICSAGSSELPARKAGGIRGLLFGSTTEAMGPFKKRNQSNA
ncbi:UV radiation resistance-associated gene protein [Erysiphe neolycopersici]|uniref:Autophagy-related protein 14 n=1 Tax=Erysiphe neolycopersici TaxID=212602 RepID=A0A420HFP1_9PEZI|nr:UV radiation resistance-associated gene protein [Erysiphe neolycopersici]